MKNNYTGIVFPNIALIKKTKLKILKSLLRSKENLEKKNTRKNVRNGLVTANLPGKKKKWKIRKHFDPRFFGFARITTRGLESDTDFRAQRR